MYKSVLPRIERTSRLRELAYDLYKTFDESMRIFTRYEYHLIHDEFMKKKSRLSTKIFCWNKKLWFFVFYNEIFIGKKQL